MIQQQQHNEKSWQKCGKTRYASARWALWDLDRIGNISDRATKPIRPYLCHTCGAWHLTSKEFDAGKC